MKIVLDTNVLLSGIFGRGLCESLLDAVLGSEKWTVVLSEHILREFADHAADKFGAPPDEIRQTVAFLRTQVQLVEPLPLPPNSCRDADDLPVLGTALAAGADCLITGDKDLLDLREFRGVPILPPRAIFGRIE